MIESQQEKFSGLFSLVTLAVVNAAKVGLILVEIIVIFYVIILPPLIVVSRVAIVPLETIDRREIVDDDSRWLKRFLDNALTHSIVFISSQSELGTGQLWLFLRSYFFQRFIDLVVVENLRMMIVFDVPVV